MKFTGHNIALSNNEKTMGDSTILLNESNLWKSIRNTVEIFYPNGPANNKNTKVVDLGCLEGGYTVEFARMGFESLGIEVREDNIDKCNYVKSNLNLTNLNFAKDDVRNIKHYGKFDITLCYGLLYHLDNPVEYLKLLSDSTNKLLIIHTHYAPVNDFRYSLGPFNKIYRKFEKRIKFLDKKRNYNLSPITINEGYRGRWYKEWSPKISKSKVDKSLWASHKNPRSFWLLKNDLIKAIYNAGFDHVFEQTNFIGDLALDNYIDYYDRSMFVAFKK